MRYSSKSSSVTVRRSMESPQMRDQSLNMAMVHRRRLLKPAYSKTSSELGSLKVMASNEGLVKGQKLLKGVKLFALQIDIHEVLRVRHLRGQGRSCRHGSKCLSSSACSGDLPRSSHEEGQSLYLEHSYLTLKSLKSGVKWLAE
jgi:hypothetical protein